MGNSLQDQLLGLGVANKKQVNAAKKEKRIATKKKHKQGVDDSLEYKAALEKKRLEKAEQDRELNQKKNEEAQQKAIQAQINQLIEMNQIEIKGETPYQFVNAGKIQKLYITDDAQAQLSNGRLVLVALNDDVKAVGAKVADKIEQRDASRVLLHNENTEPDDDDPYADFQIPDDLMW